MARPGAGAQEPMEARTAKLHRDPKTGRWHIRYTRRDPVTGDYRQVSTACGTRDAARAHAELDEWRRQCLAIGAQQAQVTPTLAPLLDQYLAALRQEHPDKGRSQAKAVRPVRQLLGDRRPDELGRDTVRDYLRRRAGTRALSTATLRNELVVVMAALRWAKKEGLIADIPLFDLPPEAPARDVWLDEATEARVHAAALAELHDPPGRNARDRDAAYHAALFVLIALNTAARREAITDLTWDRVRLAKGMIDFRVPGRRITRKRRVELPIAARLEPVLEHAWLKAQAEGRAGPARVFPMLWIDLNLKRFRERHGFPELTPHVCRHTWATLAARRGVDLYKIAGVLGDTMKTVMDTYLHHAPGHLKQALDANGTLQPA